MQNEFLMTWGSIKTWLIIGGEPRDADRTTEEGVPKWVRKEATQIGIAASNDDSEGYRIPNKARDIHAPTYEVQEEE
jgi:hypothetical protein